MVTSEVSIAIKVGNPENGNANLFAILCIYEVLEDPELIITSTATFPMNR